MPRRMTDKKLVKFASEFRKGMLGGEPSDMMCFAICSPLSTLLQMHGVECEVVEVDLGHCNHVWLRLSDGRALDPTADQFNRLFPDLDLPPVYLGEPTAIHGEQNARR